MPLVSRICSAALSAASLTTQKRFLADAAPPLKTAGRLRMDLAQRETNADELKVARYHRLSSIRVNANTVNQLLALARPRPPWPQPGQAAH
jgi:hypothetical protein